jgi:hypothetical protein
LDMAILAPLHSIAVYTEFVTYSSGFSGALVNFSLMVGR